LQKGGAENIELLKEMVRLRDENAQLLGYTTHGAFRLEVKMAKNTQTAFAFMHDLMDSIQEALVFEADELRELKHTIAPTEGEDVYFYDTAFLSSELKKQKFAVDEQRIREYFPLETVKGGMFEVYQKLLSVQFEKVTDYPVWHGDVEVYAVREVDGSIISYFMLDLYPREGKYGHAAAFNIITGYQDGCESENYIVPVACMVANFPKPHESNPSLMGHSEVETLFHEFGHIMHEVLTKARFRSQAGFATAWDFVEAPSQMLENWAWNKEVLKIISKHYLTGESLPDTVLNNMLRAKNHMIAHFTMRQMVLALYDMQLHTRGIEGKLNEEYASLVARYIGIELPEQQLFLAGFGHLREYDAGYYGYMWSLVYAADMFTRFEKEGVLNAETGREYRKWILEKGSSQEEMSLVEGFLGRPVSNEAFLKEMGL
jgi:thimet oligopeptidase